MAEELIGGFISTHMARGTLRGYGLYVTTDRIIGTKGGWKEVVGVGAGVAISYEGQLVAASGPTEGAGIGKKFSRDETTKALQLLEEKKDLEVRKEELEEVRIQRKKPALKRWFTWWGDLSIRTAKDTYAIRLVQGGAEVDMLKDMFAAFDKDKFVVEEK